MRHRSRTIKFRYGQDANEMLGRKLLLNFLAHGKITTTQRKARYLKPIIERFVSHAKSGSQSSVNEMMKMVSDRTVVDRTIKHVVPVFKDRVSGFVTSKRLMVRGSDGALTVRLDWIVPVMYEKKAEPEVIKEEQPEKKV